ncbi:MAG: ABC transporter ATP-binding protein [Mesorhizobium sp.]
MKLGTLTCEDVEVSFAAFKAVKGVSHTFQAGKLTAVIGPNGAGKTTLMNALSGHVRLSGGRVSLDGSDVTNMPVNQRNRAGLGRSFQITKIFGGMSVVENLTVASFAHRYKVQPFWAPASRFRAVRESAERVLEEIGLSHLGNRPAETLSHGDQRALEVGLALLSNPSVLLLDEPLAGVGHDQIERAVEFITKIVRGRTVLLIEHNMDAVMKISDEILVMVQGRILASGPPEQIKNDPTVRAAYLGEEG